MKEFVSSVLNLFRVKEWYASKVPMLISASLYIFALNEVTFTAENLLTIVTLTLFYSLLLSFGYVINDYADIEVDKIAGKRKVIHRFSRTTAKLFVVLPVVLGVGVILTFKRNIYIILILLVIYFFGMSYSAKPFRFKEKGIWGLIVSSSAQRCFPMLLVFAIQDVPQLWGLILWIILSFIVGLRYILVHQYIDMKNDRKSGVKTFALKKERVVCAMIPAVFISEIFLITILYIPLCIQHIWIISIIAFYVVVSVVRWIGTQSVFGHKALFSFEQIPLEDFYNQYTPLILNIILMQYDIRWAILMLFWLVFLSYTSIVHLSFPLTFAYRNIKRRNRHG